MFISQLSASKLNTYNECQLKYKLRYHDRLDPVFNEGLNTDALHYGSFVHKVLEDGLNEDTVEGLMKIAEKERKNYEFNNSKLKNFNDILVNFLKLNAQLSETVSVEEIFKIDIGDDMALNGIIDRVVKGENGKYLVIDYKTSKRAKKKVELFQDDQMKMYTYAVSKLYKVPISKIVVAHYYPHYDKLVTFSRQDIAFFLRKAKEKMWQIRKKKGPDFFASRNMFCNWCGYKDVCPVFNDPTSIQCRLNEHKKVKE